MTKAELRLLYKAKRRALSAEAVESASVAICQQWQQYLNSSGIGEKKEALYIHVFLPIKSQHEVDTWFIIKNIWQAYPRFTVITSRSDLESNTLIHFALTPESDLILNRYGIPEPNPESSLPIEASAIDLVLVPLLAFDQAGHRVGYGKGFYDRFLADCQPDCLKIGLSLFEPVDYISDTVTTDIALNVCLTPKHVWRFF